MHMKLKALLAFSAATALYASPAAAVVTVGGFNFDDNAFVDSLVASSGTYTTSGGTLAQVLTDIDASTYAFSFDTGAFVDLAFTDNVAVNGTGNDIVLFETGVPDAWNVTINGVTLNFLPVSTGSSAGAFALNAAALDLTAFGIAPGASISQLRLGFVTTGTVASTSLVGALNSGAAIGGIPEPETWAMMLLGFGFMGGALRFSRRKQNVDLAIA